jgi:hypothetical protein
MPLAFDPMDGSRLSEKIMLKQKLQRDDFSKKGHPVLAALASASARSPGPVSIPRLALQDLHLKTCT